MINCTCDRCGEDLPFVSMVNVFHAEMKELIPPYDGYMNDTEWNIHLCSWCKQDVTKEIKDIVSKKIVRPQNTTMLLASAAFSGPAFSGPAVEFKMEDIKFGESD